MNTTQSPRAHVSRRRTAVAVAAAGAGAVVKAPDEVITCSIYAVTAPNPQSSRVVTGHAWIQRSAAVSRLSMWVALYRNNVRMDEVEYADTNNARLDGWDTTTCHSTGSGDWMVGTKGFVNYPNGYNPPTGNFGGKGYFSPARPLNC
ncbi:hypothetical protein KGQ20_13065 [Catenulispora sp. NF23]|uniref:Secreted protein n=1 Tax=Catenulispora pinistramenti TaxID=2705254 RepID=A0ABS5KTR1_9ACTN|nr:hypothetical protein [Catenulispora pinistramenti]MBS2533702.1 hypothetical protein [Catenulispora pinistramenti]MBS2549442.1 hypothetical protein [Catenulispora pinistramenti]